MLLGFCQLVFSEAVDVIRHTNDEDRHVELLCTSCLGHQFLEPGVAILQCVCGSNFDVMYFVTFGFWTSAAWI